MADLEALWAEVVAYENGVVAGDGGMMAEMAGTDTGEGDLNPELKEVLQAEEEMVVVSPPSAAAVDSSTTDSDIGEIVPVPQASEVTREKMTAKKWFVIANKADLPGTEEKYWKLQQHLKERGGGHKEIGLVPISALRTEGVDRAVQWMKGLLGF